MTVTLYEHHSTRVGGFIFEVQAPGKCFKDPYNKISNLTIQWEWKIDMKKAK